MKAKELENGMIGRLRATNSKEAFLGVYLGGTFLTAAHGGISLEMLCASNIGGSKQHVKSRYSYVVEEVFELGIRANVLNGPFNFWFDRRERVLEFAKSIWRKYSEEEIKAAELEVKKQDLVLAVGRLLSDFETKNDVEVEGLKLWDEGEVTLTLK